MKTFTLFMVLFLSGFILSCSKSVEDKLSETIEKIYSLENYSYHSITKSGNNIYPEWKIFSFYLKAINDPTDSIKGARFLLYEQGTSNILINYNHYFYVNYYSHNKTAEIKTVTSVRPEGPPAPLPIKALSLLNYYMRNKDSVGIQYSNYGDSAKYIFTINNKDVFIWDLKPMIINKKNIISKYVLWTNKELLPYKLEQHLQDGTEIEEIKYRSQIDASEVLDKQKDIYLPEGYKLVDTYTHNPIIETNNFIGKKIIDLSLENVEGQQINLAKLKTNLLIEFTSKSCSACKLAIPFLINFSNTYRDKGFKVISIETYPFAKEQLIDYKKSQKIEYEYLMANKKLNENYNIKATPIFFIVDKNGIIKKEITGYGKGMTDYEIIKFANTLQTWEDK